MTGTVLDSPNYPADLNDIRSLFKEYQEEIQADLCFQSFEDELAGLPGKYSEPRGTVVLAHHNKKVAGIVALRPIENDICEMKRLYVRPEYKGLGIGRGLAERIIREARKRGYKKMRLDTLNRLESAVALYRKLGFKEMTAYYENPLEGVIYMELDL